MYSIPSRGGMIPIYTWQLLPKPSIMVMASIMVKLALQYFTSNIYKSCIVNLSAHECDVKNRVILLLTLNKICKLLLAVPVRRRTGFLMVRDQPIMPV